MNTHIHRLLDEAFESVEMTPETRELKEEIRANLMARAAELEASGLTPSGAARTALDELGPVGDLLGNPAPAPTSGPSVADLAMRNRVRPDPGFVVRATLLSVVAAAAATLAVLSATGTIAGGGRGTEAFGLAAAAVLGFVTSDALRQETTSNYAMPTARAVGWGVATFAGVGALASFGAFAAATDTLAFVIVGAVLAFGSLGLFAWLGATQTNRHKAWVQAATWRAPNRFESDTTAASRFGIYSAVIWIVGLGLAIGLGIAFAWWWALVVLGFTTVASMLLLAAMLYGRGSSRAGSK